MDYTIPASYRYYRMVVADFVAEAAAIVRERAKISPVAHVAQSLGCSAITVKRVTQGKPIIDIRLAQTIMEHEYGTKDKAISGNGGAGIDNQNSIS